MNQSKEKLLLLLLLATDCTLLLMSQGRRSVIKFRSFGDFFTLTNVLVIECNSVLVLSNDRRTVHIKSLYGMSKSLRKFCGK